MLRRLFCPLLAAVVAAAVLGTADRASAAIRITITDGSIEKVYYSSSSQSALFATDLGAFEIFLQSTISNYPGEATGGALSQSIAVSDTAGSTTGTLPTFTFTSSIIGDVAGATTGFVTGALADAVKAAPQIRFTLPTDAFLNVSSSVSALTPFGQPTGGTVQNTTNVNGVPVVSLPVGVNSGTNGTVNTGVANTPTGYTLSQQIVFTGGTPGVSGLTISGVSGVSSLTPEPQMMLAWALGAVGLGAVALRRRPPTLAV